jgi:hypothetical protein
VSNYNSYKANQHSLTTDFEVPLWDPAEKIIDDINVAFMNALDAYADV